MVESSSEIGFLLHDVARLQRKRFEHHARAIGLTRSQWQVLSYLSRNEGISQAGLADLLEVEPITLSRIVDRLVDSGLVDRTPHPSDRRVRCLRLTQAARPTLKQLRELGEVTRRETLAGVSEPDHERLIGTLLAMRSNLSGAGEATRGSQEGKQ